MMEGWVLALALFFTVLFGVVIVLLIKILTQLEIIVRAIPLGAAKVNERRPPPQSEEHMTRPVGATPARHGRSG